MGLVSLIFAAFMLYRRRDIKRMFAYSSIEHMGIIAFAFGMGGPLANFAGLLHMTMHCLTKSAIFFAVGHIAQVKGTQKIADMGGLTETHPVLGWGLVLGVVAIAGLPPLGIFMSEFLVVSSTFAREPLAGDRRWCSACWSRFGALFLRLNGVAFGEPRGATAPAQGLLRADVRASRAGARGRHLSAAGAGRLVPECREAARDSADAALHRHDRGRAGSSDHRPWPRVIVERERLARCDRASSRPADWTLLGLWGDDAARCTWRCSTKRPARSPSSRSQCPDGTFPVGRRAASAGDPARARDPRSLSG